MTHHRQAPSVQIHPLPATRHPLPSEIGLQPEDMASMIRELWKRGYKARQCHGWHIRIEGAAAPITIGSQQELDALLEHLDR